MSILEVVDAIILLPKSPADRRLKIPIRATSGTELPIVPDEEDDLNILFSISPHDFYGAARDAVAVTSVADIAGGPPWAFASANAIQARKYPRRGRITANVTGLSPAVRISNRNDHTLSVSCLSSAPDTGVTETWYAETGPDGRFQRWGRRSSDGALFLSFGTEGGSETVYASPSSAYRRGTIQGSVTTLISGETDKVQVVYTLGAGHDLGPGDRIRVAGVGSPHDGIQRVRDATATTIRCIVAMTTPTAGTTGGGGTWQERNEWTSPTKLDDILVERIPAVYTYARSPESVEFFRNGASLGAVPIDPTEVGPSEGTSRLLGVPGYSTSPVGSFHRMHAIAGTDRVREHVAALAPMEAGLQGPAPFRYSLECFSFPGVPRHEWPNCDFILDTGDDEAGYTETGRSYASVPGVIPTAVFPRPGTYRPHLTILSPAFIGGVPQTSRQVLFSGDLPEVTVLSPQDNLVAQYYVASSGGSDTGPGSETNPFAGFNRAMLAAKSHGGDPVGVFFDDLGTHTFNSTQKLSDLGEDGLLTVWPRGGSGQASFTWTGGTNSCFDTGDSRGVRVDQVSFQRTDIGTYFTTNGNIYGCLFSRCSFTGEGMCINMPYSDQYNCTYMCQANNEKDYFIFHNAADRFASIGCHLQGLMVGGSNNSNVLPHQHRFNSFGRVSIYGGTGHDGFLSDTYALRGADSLIIQIHAFLGRTTIAGVSRFGGIGTSNGWWGAIVENNNCYTKCNLALNTAAVRGNTFSSISYRPDEDEFNGNSDWVDSYGNRYRGNNSPVIVSGGNPRYHAYSSNAGYGSRTVANGADTGNPLAAPDVLLAAAVPYGIVFASLGYAAGGVVPVKPALQYRPLGSQTWLEEAHPAASFVAAIGGLNPGTTYEVSQLWTAAGSGGADVRGETQTLTVPVNLETTLGSFPLDPS